MKILDMFRKQADKVYGNFYATDWNGTALIGANTDDLFTNYTFASIIKRAKGFSSIPNYFVDKNKKQVTTKYDELIKKPNEYMTESEFKLMVSVWLDYHGNAYVWYNGTNLFVLPSIKVKVKTQKAYPFISGYEYNGQTYSPDEIIHIKYILPHDTDFGLNTYLGRGIYAAAGNTASQADKEIMNMIYSFAKSSAVSPFILMTNGTYDDTQFNTLKAEWKKAFPNNELRAVIENGDKVEQLTSKENFASLVKDGADVAAVKRLAAIYEVPYGLLDTSSQQNKATVDTNYYMFRKDTIEPIMNHYEEVMTAFFQKKFPELKGLELSHDEFVYTDPETDNKEKLALLQAYNLGIVSKNQVLEKFKLPPLKVDEYKTEPEPIIPIEEPKEEEPEDEKPIKRMTWKTYRGLGNGYLNNQVRTLFFKSYDNRAKQFEDRLKPVLRKEFSDIQKTVVSNLDNVFKSYQKSELNTDIEFFNIEQVKKELSKSVSPAVSSYVIEMLESACEDIGAVFNETKFRSIIREIIKSSTDKITDSIDTLGRNVKETVSTIAEKNPMATREELFTLFKESLNNKFDDVFKESRIETIAETTATSGRGSAQRQVYGRDCVWLTQRDKKVRVSHAVADGSEPDENGMFHVGGDKMDSPGNGSVAAQNVKCRCMLMPIIKSGFHV